MVWPHMQVPKGRRASAAAKLGERPCWLANTSSRAASSATKRAPASACKRSITRRRVSLNNSARVVGALTRSTNASNSPRCRFSLCPVGVGWSIARVFQGAPGAHGRCIWAYCTRSAGLSQLPMPFVGVKHSAAVLSPGAEISGQMLHPYYGCQISRLGRPQQR